MHVLMRNAASNSVNSLGAESAKIAVPVTVVVTAMGMRRSRSIGLQQITATCWKPVEVLKSECHEIQPHPRPGPNACTGLQPGNGGYLLNYMPDIKYQDSSYIRCN